MQSFQVREWKPCQKNTLQGFVSFVLPSGMVLNDCTLHQKNRSRWIGLPARPYKKDDGSTSYMPIVDFVDKETRQKFQQSALAALDLYIGSLARMHA